MLSLLKTNTTSWASVMITLLGSSDTQTEDDYVEPHITEFQQ